jgi:GNAT superfamily N-acetyltransferase
MMNTFSIRDAELARDKAAFLDFIMGSQRYEHAFEPNRRLDPPVADEHLAKMTALLAHCAGKILVAADERDEAIGWAIVVESEDDIYVVANERRYAYIAELFVIEPLRGTGAGRALIAACEDWAREHGIGVMQIGVLPGNSRAHGIYQRQGYADYGIQLRKYLR